MTFDESALRSPYVLYAKKAPSTDCPFEQTKSDGALKMLHVRPNPSPATGLELLAGVAVVQNPVESGRKVRGANPRMCLAFAEETIDANPGSCDFKCGIVPADQCCLTRSSVATSIRVSSAAIKKDSDREGRSADAMLSALRWTSMTSTSWVYAHINGVKRLSATFHGSSSHFSSFTMFEKRKEINVGPLRSFLWRFAAGSPSEDCAKPARASIAANSSHNAFDSP
mmetsp:Transcript_8685/g.19365  ORF Transcript_8685/g.19365 Transcript_8685/m.19365 type:complete len:226 (-) Transcript_8685:241-918(-)